jgi:hypothetical protein
MLMLSSPSEVTYLSWRKRKMKRKTIGKMRLGNQFP